MDCLDFVSSATRLNQRHLIPWNSLLWQIGGSTIAMMRDGQSYDGEHRQSAFESNDSILASQSGRCGLNLLDFFRMTIEENGRRTVEALSDLFAVKLKSCTPASIVHSGKLPD
jgi:hypothetical protein